MQEALTNVVRHAKAKHVDVRIVPCATDALELAVSDDGIGLPMGERPSGFGLIGIRERVATRAGRMQLSSTRRGRHRIVGDAALAAPTEEVES